MGFINAVAGAGLLLATVYGGGDLNVADLVGDCCTLIHNEYSNLVILQDGYSYSNANQRWSETAELSPICITQPSSSDVLSSFIKTLVKGECPFAIKSGGHNPWPGVNDINEGVVVDLSNIIEVSLSYDRTP